MKTTVFVLALLAAGAEAAPSSNVPAPTPPAPEAFSETRFGQTLSDPYRWFERDARAADLASWVKAASSHTVAELGALPERAQFARVLEQTTRAGVRYSDLQSAGAFLFYQRLEPADRVPTLVVRHEGVERVLLDPTAGTSEVAAIGNYSLSRDGRTVAVHVARGGAETGEIRFLDVATGKQVGAALGPIWGEFPVNWLDDRHVVYTRLASGGANADPMQNMQAAVTRVGQPGGVVILGNTLASGPAFEPQEFPLLEASSLSPWVLGLGDGARSDSRVLVARDRDLAQGKPAWREIAGYADQITGFVQRGDTLFTISTRGTPNGAVSRRDLKPGAPSVASLVLAQGDLVLTGLAATADGLYVSAQRDGVSHLLYLADGRGQPMDVALPIEGGLDDLTTDADGRSVTFALNGWLTATEFYRVTRGKLKPLGLASATWSGASRFSTLREEAVSADGTRVPMVVLLPKAGTPERPLPTILEGYGSYGVMSVSPWYNPNALAWLAQGGAFASCGTRGGGERGRDWHEGGRGANKPNAQADFIACAERLNAIGISSARTLTATGTSAGGALVPAAVLRRPELFTALVSRVAIVNASRLEAAENGANQFAEFGDPRTEDGFASLLKQDGYLMLQAARAAPDMLVTIGLNDKRVAPWMGAKFAALATSRFGDKRLVLIRADTEAGHGIGSAREGVIAEWADTFAFAWNLATRR